MPFKKRLGRRRFTRRRRVFRRRRSRFMRKRKSRISSLTLRRPTLFPDSLLTKMVFYESIIFADAGGGQVNETYMMNDIFEPKVGATVRPLGWDELSQIYNRFEVFTSKILVRAVNSTIVPCEFIIVPSSDSTIEAINVARTYPYARLWHIGSVEAKNGIKNMPHMMNIRKFEGRRSTDISYTGSITSSPVNRRFWQISSESQTGTSSYSLNLDVRIVYYVKWYIRLPLGPSLIEAAAQPMEVENLAGGRRPQSRVKLCCTLQCIC